MMIIIISLMIRQTECSLVYLLYIYINDVITFGSYACFTYHYIYINNVITSNLSFPSAFSQSRLLMFSIINSEHFPMKDII